MHELQNRSLGPTTQKKILVVEDEENLRETLRYKFTAEGYRVTAAADGEKAVALAKASRPDLILLDIMLPGLDGLEVCRILRKDMSVPILMLTARDEVVDKVVGLEVGADDYVTKPFSMRELVARVRALLRRAEGPTPASNSEEPQSLTRGDLKADVVAHKVWLHGRELELKPKEFDLLVFLMSNRGRAVTRELILAQVWGYEVEVDTRTVDVHVRWLRERIEADPARPTRISTIRGVGYRFEG
ncbi:MAG: response regulator transcription factor [Chloroflexi bacterium]|nr:response regulator transcription factor [Chloroflexota bacterium]